MNRYLGMCYLPLLLIALTAPLAAQQPKWEYGQLITQLQSFGREDLLTWSAGDSTVGVDSLSKPWRDAFKWREFQGSTNTKSGATPIVRMMNLLGSQGWELIAVQDNRYVFRRQRQP